MQVLDLYGPVSVGIDASNPKFISYNDDYYGSIPGICNKNYIGTYAFTFKNIFFSTPVCCLSFIFLILYKYF